MPRPKLIVSTVMCFMFLAIAGAAITPAQTAPPQFEVKADSPVFWDLFDRTAKLEKVADGFGFHIPRGYLYFAIAFSLIVELLNLRARKNAPPED